MPLIDIDIPEVVYEKLPHIYISTGLALLFFGGKVGLTVLGVIFTALGISVFNARRIHRKKKLRKKAQLSRNAPPK